MATKNPNDFESLLETGRWFDGLPRQLRQALLDNGQVRSFTSESRLFSRGDPTDGIYAVLDGAIAVSGSSAAGKQALLIITEPPSWFGEIGVFDERPRSHDAVAVSDTTVLHISQERIHELLASEPRWWRELARLMANKLRLAFAAMEENALLPAATRLASRLVTIAERYGEWRGMTSRVVDVRQEQLAQMLSISRQTANQVLKQLESEGLIKVSYASVEIVDLQGLRARSGLE